MKTEIVVLFQKFNERKKIFSQQTVTPTPSPTSFHSMHTAFEATEKAIEFWS